MRDTSSGFTKVSIVVRLSGSGHVGEGEDITWDQIDQIEFLRSGHDLTWLHGTRTFDELSTLLGMANLFPVEPIRDSARFYRRWAFESAALDLALRQNGVSLHEAVGRTTRPVTFVASVRIGDPPSLAPLQEWLAVDPELRFKLDPTPGWDDDLVAELARLGCVDVIDLKGRYFNVNVAMDAELGLYRRVIEGLPGAWIEDPALEPSTEGMLERHRDRITWDEPIHSVADIEGLPWQPRMLNLKPARFGSVRALFDALRPLRGARHRRLRRRDVRAGSGAWAAPVPGLVVSSRTRRTTWPPTGYNLQSSPHELPRSPLPPEPHPTGFRWGTYDARRTPSRPRSEVLSAQWIPEVERALLLIADIGGYTEYMSTHRMSLAHAEVNTARLLEAVIDAGRRLRPDRDRGRRGLPRRARPTASTATPRWPR